MSEVVSELDDSEFEGEDDSSDDDFEGYINGDMLDEYDEDSVEGELNVRREEIVRSVVEIVVDRVEKNMNLMRSRDQGADQMVKCTICS